MAHTDIHLWSKMALTVGTLEYNKLASNKSAGQLFHNNMALTSSTVDKVDSTLLDQQQNYFQLLLECSMHCRDDNLDFQADHNTRHLVDVDYEQGEVGLSLIPAVLVRVPVLLLSRTHGEWSPVAELPLLPGGSSTSSSASSSSRH